MATTIPYNFLDLSNFTEEEYEAERVRLRQPISEEQKQRRLAALRSIEEHHRQFLERGGIPVSEEDMLDAFSRNDED